MAQDNNDDDDETKTEKLLSLVTFGYNQKSTWTIGE